MDSSHPIIGDTVPAEPENYVPILRVKGAGRLYGLVISHRLVGSWQHWLGDHTVACIEPREECAGCRCRYRRQWRGYVACKTAGRYPVSIFEFTLDAALPWRKRLEGWPPGIHGHAITLTRREGQRRGMVMIDIAAVAAVPRALPPCPDVAAIVRAMLAAPPRDKRRTLPEPGDDNDELLPYPGVG